MSRFFSCAFALAVLQGGCGSKEKPRVTAPPAPAVAPAEAAAARTLIAAEPVAAEAPVDSADVEAPSDDEAVGTQPSTLPAAVKAAAETGLAGCVGFSRDGEKALVYLMYKKSAANVTRAAVWLSATPIDGQERTYLYEAECGGEGEPTCVNGLPARTAQEDDALTGAILGRDWVPCESQDSATATGDAVVKPLGQPVTVSVDGAELTFAIAGGDSHRLVAFDQVDEATARTFTAYASATTQHVFVALRTEMEPGEFVVTTHVIRGSELGLGPCISVAKRNEAAAEVTLAPVADKATDVGCFAMTTDGKAALMAVKSEDTMPAMDGEEEGEADADDALSLVWAGQDLSPPPGCILDSSACKDSEGAAREAFIEQHGLTSCPQRLEKLRAGGGSFELDVKADRLWFVHPTLGHRWLMSFKVDAHDGGDHESFEAAWQHPRGGPLFVLYRNEDTGLNQRLAKAIPTSAFGFCEEAP